MHTTPPMVLTTKPICNKSKEEGGGNYNPKQFQGYNNTVKTGSKTPKYCTECGMDTHNKNECWLLLECLHCKETGHGPRRCPNRDGKERCKLCGGKHLYGNCALYTSMAVHECVHTLSRLLRSALISQNRGLYPQQRPYRA